MQLLFAGQFLPRVNDDWQIRSADVRLKFFDQIKAGHVGKFQIEHHAIEAFTFQHAQGFLTRGHGGGVYVAIANQFHDAHALHVIVLHHQ